MAKRKTKLTGARKAAIFMLSIGEERAANLFSHMDDFEIRDVSREMANLGSIASDEVEVVMEEFTDTVGGAGGGIVGGWSTTERFLKSFMGDDRVTDLMEEMRGPAGRTTWEKLANVSEDMLAAYLKNEYPQTVAVIISRIRPAHAARVLSTLPEDLAIDVIERTLAMDNVTREILESVEESLRTEFMRNLAAKNKRDTHEMMAEIFNNFDRTNEQKFMDLLESKSEEDAEKIRNLMFTFEDILKTDDAGMQTILREVEKDQLALALKGASDDLKAFILQNMSERASTILEEDMAAMGPVRVKDVDEAQMAVVEVAKRLVDAQAIMLQGDSEEDEFL